MAAVVGAVLLAVPGSPIHKKAVLGLDLQGGLEVVLKAVPPKGQQVDAAGMVTAQEIVQSRIDKLGVSSPEVRRQGTNQIVVELAGVHDPAKAAALIGKTAQLQLFDFEADLTGPSTSSSGAPVATPTLYDLLTQVQTQAAKGSPESYYLFRNKTTTKTTPAAKKGGKPTTTTTVKHSLVQGPANTRTELLRPYGGNAPAGTQVMEVPDHTTVVSCAETTGCLGVNTNAAISPTYYYLLKYFPTRKTGAGPVPEMTGSDLVRSGTTADFSQSTGLPVVLLQFTGHGASEFGKITAAEAHRGQIAWQIAGSPSGTAYQNYVQHFAIVLDGQLAVDAVHRLQAEPGRHRRPERRDRPRPGRLLHRREEPCARPADRRAAVQLPAGRADRRLGDARQGLADAGVACRARRSHHRRDLPAHPVPLPRPRRGLRPRHLRGALLRGHPALQRHADAAGLRGPDPHHRRRGRRERRRLRTHQGRSAVREVRAARRSRPDTARASTRFSTRTSSRRSRRSCCS